MVIIVKYFNDTTKYFNKIKDIFDDNQLNIIYLNCSRQNLKELPVEIGHLINLQYFCCLNNKLSEFPIEIINCRNLIEIRYFGNEIIMNPVIQRFLDRHHNINNHILYDDKQNVHTSSVQQSIKESIINLLKDTY